MTLTGLKDLDLPTAVEEGWSEIGEKTSSVVTNNRASSAQSGFRIRVHTKKDAAYL